jgi:hypothetical protein
MNIFEEIRKLNLPQVSNVPAGQTRQYAVVGSGVLAAHGIRDFKDIDLLATAELYEKLPAYSWKEKIIRPNFVVLEKGIAEASPTMMTIGKYRPDFKRVMGREKDVEDSRLIKEYVAKLKKFC